MLHKLCWLLLAILLAFIGCQKQSVQKKEIVPVPVTVAAVIESDMQETISVTGHAYAKNKAVISAKSMGTVLKMELEEGDSVEAGDVIAVLDTQALLAKKAQAQASIDLSLQSKKQTRAMIEEIELRLKNALKNKNRFDALYAKKAVQQKEWEDVTLQYELLQVKKKQLQAQEKISVKQAEVSRQQLKELDVNLNDATIRAPFSGIISKKNLAAGELAMPGTPVVELTDLSSMRIHLNIPDTYRSRVKEGAPVSLSLWAQAQEIKGEINSVIPVLQEGNYVFQAIMDMENPENIIADHAFIQAEIQTGFQKNTLIVPRETLLEDDGQSYVFVINDDQAYLKYVETGLQNKQSVQILKGLEMNDSIALQGKNNLSNEQNVRVMNND